MFVCVNLCPQGKKQFGRLANEPMTSDSAMSEDCRERLDRLLAEGESETTEFKESLDREALETVAAFANTRGGTLLIGVHDDGTVRGITLGKA